MVQKVRSGFINKSVEVTAMGILQKFVKFRSFFLGSRDEIPFCAPSVWCYMADRAHP